MMDETYEECVVWHEAQRDMFFQKKAIIDLMKSKLDKFLREKISIYNLNRLKLDIDRLDESC